MQEDVDFGAYKRNDLCRFSDKSMCEFFVERDEMPNIDVAVVLFEKDIFSDLISTRAIR
jgi:hypothetical protein